MDTDAVMAVRDVVGDVVCDIVALVVADVVDTDAVMSNIIIIIRRLWVARKRRPVNLKLLHLIRAPYVSFGVKYIDLVSLAPFSGKQPPVPVHLDLSRAPYGFDLSRAPYVWT